MKAMFKGKQAWIPLKWENTRQGAGLSTRSFSTEASKGKVAFDFGSRPTGLFAKNIDPDIESISFQNLLSVLWNPISNLKGTFNNTKSFNA